MPTSLVEPEDAATDVTRQAELVVMDCLKSWNCPRALNALAEKLAGSQVSPIASERFSNDMKEKKKCCEGRITLLEYLMSISSKDMDLSLSSIRRRSGSARQTGELGIEWSKEEISALKKAIKKTCSVHDKNARWKQIAAFVGNDKTKKHCYVKYKELKEEQTNNAARKASPRRKRSSSKGESDQIDNTSNAMPTQNGQNEVIDNGKVNDVESSSKVERPTLESLEKPATAFVMSQRTSSVKTDSSCGSSKALEIEDCEDVGTLLEQPITGMRTKSAVNSSFAGGATRVPTASEVAIVQQLLFGSNKKAFSSHWEEQGFVFSTVHDLQFGLVQHQGGPCGILAVVQGYVLRFLLQHAPVDWKNIDVSTQEWVLVQALTHILWQCAQDSKCVVAVKDAAAGGQRKFMAGYKLHIATTEEQTRQMITAYLPQFMDPKGSGLVQFVISVLLTKGIENIESEMDHLAGNSGNQLIGAHDYCTQEIVNLLLCGCARSNVFDDDKVLEGTSASDPGAVVLHGISSQSMVGFLSLFEAYENLVVGSNLKQPRMNIWVVCSESHYSVLFVADPRALEDHALDTRSSVDLLYYDGLANQDEEIRLTVNTMALVEQRTSVSHDDLIPPLDLVIRTKWPRATVDWNGVEPLL